jgi:integrase
MSVVAIPKRAEVETAPKTVAATQKAIDALPLDSGMWTLEGCPGLFVRCRAKSKSFMLQRRVQGQLVKETLGEMPVKRAKEKATKIWSALKPKPAAQEVVTLEIAIDRYLEEKNLAPKTKDNYQYNREHYLKGWKDRSLHDVGNDRAGFRFLIGQIKKKHGTATSNQVIRLVSAVYRWQRKIDTTLPEPPTIAVEVEAIPARDWAYSAGELREWWYAREEKDGAVVELGVKTLGPIKRMWWLTALFTGARKGAIEELKWTDIDFEQKIIQFYRTSPKDCYVVPMPDKLAALLEAYRHGADAIPSEWVFPSTRRDGQHIIGVKNDKEGAGPAHRLRHTFRTTLAQLRIPGDHSRMLMGHSLRGDVSRDYITAALVVEPWPLRPITNAVADHYQKILVCSSGKSKVTTHAVPHGSCWRCSRCPAARDGHQGPSSPNRGCAKRTRSPE